MHVLAKTSPLFMSFLQMLSNDQNNASKLEHVCKNENINNVVIQCFPERAEVPNVFTPNGDGVNDTFSIVSLNYEEVDRMRIWDRWGNKVYDGQGPWDGTYNDKQVAQDIYIYHIIVGCPATVEAEDNVLKGDVTLLR